MTGKVKEKQSRKKLKRRYLNKIITENDVIKAELENKAMNLRREELQKEDKKLLKQINKNIKLIESYKKVKKCKKSK